MASFNLHCSPSIADFSAHQFLPPPPSLSPFLKPSLSNSTFPSLFLSIRPGPSLFPLRSSAQTLTELEQSPSVEEDGEEEDEVSRTRLLAQNVPWTSTVDDLRPLFENYGTVVDIELSMYNKIRNRGLAFITMGSHEEALAAINNLESYEYKGRVLRLNWAKPKNKPSAPQQPKPVPVHNLFVANLPYQARAKDLKEFFNADSANVVSAEIIFYDNPRRSAGYGFVSFNTKEEAEAALSAFQGKEFMGRSIRVARSKKFLRQGQKDSDHSENDVKE